MAIEVDSPSSTIVFVDLEDSLRSFTSGNGDNISKGCGSSCDDTESGDSGSGEAFVKDDSSSESFARSSNLFCEKLEGSPITRTFENNVCFLSVDELKVN